MVNAVVLLFVESTEFCSPVCLDVSRRQKLIMKKVINKFFCFEFEGCKGTPRKKNNVTVKSTVFHLLYNDEFVGFLVFF